MPKKNSISYIRPQEPAFITRMKAAIGYTGDDEPTVDTKRRSMPTLDDDDDDDVERDEEKPVVVVLVPGDISAEEAEKIKAQENLSEKETKANLDERIVFQAPVKTASVERKKRPHSEDKGKRKKVAKDSKSLLSFDDEENDDE